MRNALSKEIGTVEEIYHEINKCNSLKQCQNFIQPHKNMETKPPFTFLMVKCQK